MSGAPGGAARRVSLSAETVARARALVRRSQLLDSRPAFNSIEDVLVPALAAGLALLEDLYADDVDPAEPRIPGSATSR